MRAKKRVLREIVRDRRCSRRLMRSKKRWHVRRAQTIQLRERRIVTGRKTIHRRVERAREAPDRAKPAPPWRHSHRKCIAAASTHRWRIASCTEWTTQASRVGITSTESMAKQTDCPCHSGLRYSACCEPFHQRAAIAETPEKLMRSRYAAFG